MNAVTPSAHTPVRLSEQETQQLSAQFQGKPPQQLLKWASEKFGSGLTVCSSFQAEGVSIIDMAWRVNPAIRVFTIDTGRTPQETYVLMDKIREKYGIEIEVYLPDAVEVEQMVKELGVNLFYKSITNRFMCCDVRKVHPLNKVLATRNIDAWVAGLRRTQGETRSKVGIVEFDKAHGGLVKLNPLAEWTSEQVWDYIKANDVPYNELYDKGFTSIGCWPCTRAIKPGEDERAGRWWWELDAAKECGINVDPRDVKASQAGQK